MLLDTNSALASFSLCFYETKMLHFWNFFFFSIWEYQYILKKQFISYAWSIFDFIATGSNASKNKQKFMSNDSCYMDTETISAFCLSLSLYSKFVDMTISLNLPNVIQTQIQKQFLLSPLLTLKLSPLHKTQAAIRFPSK